MKPTIEKHKGERFAMEHGKLSQKQLQRMLGNVVTVLTKVDHMSEDRIKKAISDLEVILDYLRGFVAR